MRVQAERLLMIHLGKRLAYDSVGQFLHHSWHWTGHLRGTCTTPDTEQGTCEVLAPLLTLNRAPAGYLHHSWQLLCNCVVSLDWWFPLIWIYFHMCHISDWAETIPLHFSSQRQCLSWKWFMSFTAVHIAQKVTEGLSDLFKLRFILVFLINGGNRSERVFLDWGAQFSREIPNEKS